MTASGSFTKGKQDTPLYLSRIEQPYEQEVHAAYNMKVDLYEIKDRRGWLVDGASALLHITVLSSALFHTRRVSSSKPTISDTLIREVGYSPPREP